MKSWKLAARLFFLEKKVETNATCDTVVKNLPTYEVRFERTKSDTVPAGEDEVYRLTLVLRNVIIYQVKEIPLSK